VLVRNVPRVLLAVLVLGLGIGLARLCALRYAAGDVYPRYSSLRADPLGAKAFHDALVETGGLRVVRNTRPIGRLWTDTPGTILLLGVPSWVVGTGSGGLDTDLEALVRHGGRAVVAVTPDTREPATPKRDAVDGEQERPGRDAKEPDGEPGDAEEERRTVPITRRLGFDLTRLALPVDSDGEPTAGTATLLSPGSGDEALPSRLSWHTAVCFKGLDPAWRVVYARDGRPVLVERTLGEGTLVLSADSYFFSNEGLSREPHAALLAWIVGGNRVVVFDETHLGVAESVGIATLLRRYRLQGLCAAILLLAGLFVWRASASFLPPRPGAEAGPGETIGGRDAAAGLVTLLRRGIPESAILDVCREEWTKSYRRRRPDLAAALEGWSARSGDPVDGYRRISQLLEETKVTDER